MQSVWQDPLRPPEYYDSLKQRLVDIENQAFWGGLNSSQREVVLERQTYMARQEVSQQLLERAQFDVMEDVRRHAVVVLAKAMIPGKRRSEELVITEEPRYLSWRHELIAGLPVDSFRRRFLERFWEIDGDTGYQVEHVVTADTGFVFPECDYVFPDQLGPIHFITSVTATSR